MWNFLHAYLTRVVVDAVAADAENTMHLSVRNQLLSYTFVIVHTFEYVTFKTQ